MKNKPICYDFLEENHISMECYLNNKRCSCKKYDLENQTLQSSIKAIRIAFLHLCYQIGIYKILDWLNKKLN